MVCVLESFDLMDDCKFAKKFENKIKAENLNGGWVYDGVRKICFDLEPSEISFYLGYFIITFFIIN